MGQYDFTTRPNRLKQFTYKWQSSEDNPDLLQLWVIWISTSSRN